MAMIVTQTDDHTFHVIASEPELTFLKDVSQGLRMPIPTLFGACITQGISYYYALVLEAEQHDKQEAEKENTEQVDTEETG